MKTNISKLPEGNFGKFLGTAMYAVRGTCTEDAEYEICDIFELVGGGLIARAYDMLFSVEETNWPFWPEHNPTWNNPCNKRGRHSRSRNKEASRPHFIACETDELPF